MKKALLTAAGIGGTVTVLKYKSPHSQEHSDSDASNGTQGPPEVILKSKSALKDELKTAARGTSRSLAAALRSARKALRTTPQEEDTLGAGGGDGTTGESLSPAVAAAAAFLGGLAPQDGTMNDIKESVFLARRLAGSGLVGRLLSAAASAPAASSEFHEAAHYVAFIMNDQDAASALLSREGNCDIVLHLAEASPEVRAAALRVLSLPKTINNNNINGILGPASTEDIEHALHLVRSTASTTTSTSETSPPAQQPEDQRLLALRMLRHWSQYSVRNCQALASAGVGEAVCTAAIGAPENEVDARREIALLMNTLATDTPSSAVPTLHMESWMWPVLCFAADAAGVEDWDLVISSLGAFSAAVGRGCRVPPGLMQGSVLPMLRHVAHLTDGAQKMALEKSTEKAQKDQKGGKVALGVPSLSDAMRLRCQAAKCVRALGEGNGVVFGIEDRLQWVEILLSWLVEADSGSKQQRALRSSPNKIDNKNQAARTASTTAAAAAAAATAAVEALSAMAAPPGAEGLQVSHAWLAEMIVYLSRQVQPFAPKANKKKKKKESGEDVAAAAPGGWRAWIPSLSKPSSTSTDIKSTSTSTISSTSTTPIEQSEETITKAPEISAAETTGAEMSVAEMSVPPMDSPEEVEAQEIIADQATRILREAMPNNNTTLEEDTSDTNYNKIPLSETEVGEEAPAAAVSSWGAWGAWAPSWPSTSWSSSWWRRGSENANDAASLDNAEASSRAPSDSELALYITAAPVGPAYARSVAAELIEASGRVGVYTEPPANSEDLLPPTAVASYPTVSAAVDIEVAERALCQALKVLCALAAGDEGRRAWLVTAGALPMLQRVALEHGRDVAYVMAEARLDNKKTSKKNAAETDNNNDTKTNKGVELEVDVEVEESLPLPALRQVARLLALLSADVAGAGALASGGWVPWLQRLATSTDCKVASCAARAVLHVESAAATVRGNGREGSLLAATGAAGEKYAGALCRAAAAGCLLPSRADAVEIQEEEGREENEESEQLQQQGQQQGQEFGPMPGISDISAIPGGVAEIKEGIRLPPLDAALMKLRRGLEQLTLDAARPALSLEERLVLHDGIHLFDPLAPHHEPLARHGIKDAGTDAPSIDIVFVHGMRGGAFVTWRRDGVLALGAARENLDRSVCWPTSWLAPVLPQARLISAEYAAPATGWEGESLPLQHTAEHLAARLAAAGVGHRPVVFVTHSMGGLIVKEVLARGKRPDATPAQRALSQATTGVVFYSVPHAGSPLADLGWTLRYVGVSPSHAVSHMKSGPHLEESNAAVRGMARRGELSVLSFSEGMPTQLAYVMTRVVPHESAYPGYGEFVVLAEHDHISVCKPKDKEDPAYSVLLTFLQARAADAARKAAERRADAADHMEAAL